MQAVRFYQRPVIPLTVALMAGIALGGAAPGWEGSAFALALACGLGTGRCLIRGTPAAVLPLVLFFSLAGHGGLSESWTAGRWNLKAGANSSCGPKASQTVRKPVR